MPTTISSFFFRNKARGLVTGAMAGAATATIIQAREGMPYNLSFLLYTLVLVGSLTYAGGRIGKEAERARGRDNWIDVYVLQFFVSIAYNIYAAHPSNTNNDAPTPPAP